MTKLECLGFMSSIYGSRLAADCFLEMTMESVGTFLNDFTTVVTQSVALFTFSDLYLSLIVLFLVV